MLAAMRGTAVSATIYTGADQFRVRRFGFDLETGAPSGELGGPTSIANPRFGYFVGASLYFDPVAFGVGMYDLSNRFQLAGAEPLRYHLAPDPDADCLDPTLGGCPPNGGSATWRQDITLALALNRANVQFGAAVHFPRLRRRFAFDNDTELTPAPERVQTARCEFKEDPQCAERVGFKGWTRWIPQDGAPAGFDAAVTVGVAFQLRRDTISFGARYRTFPLRRGGQVVLGGQALVCRPDVETASMDGRDIVPPCELASPVGATLRERLPQEVAFGGSFVLGRARLWHLDTNFYWIDFCPGGLRAGQCGGRDAQTLSLVGLDRNSFVLPEFKRHTGRQDLYGVDAHATYRLRSNVSLTFGTQLNSPSVRRGSQTAAMGDGWRLGLSFGTRLRIKSTNVLITPGYALDVLLPRTVTAQRASFSPESSTNFFETGGDLNTTGASDVLSGRARPTNAARYFGLLHTLALSVRWGEASGVLE